MSLNIYRELKSVPANLGKVIDYNDEFFNGTLLEDNGIVRDILFTIDKAKYHSELTFIGRDADLGALNKSCLSTGCKTLLNIISNPDRCFDVAECGNNALSMFPKIRNGNVLWRVPMLHYLGMSTCDIKIDDRHFTNFEDFLEYTMEGQSWLV